MKLKLIVSALLSALSFSAYANQPSEKFTYCSNGTCRLITTEDFVYSRGMPNDLNFSCKKNNQYALTFDDGPSANYTRLLEILKKHDVKATFFVVGGNLQNEDADKLYGKMVSAGHFMANHTLNHRDLTGLSPEEIYAQIAESRDALLNAPSVKNLSSELRQKLESSTKYVRPPFGNIDHTVDQLFKANGYTSVRWNADRYDWNMPATQETTQTIVQRVVQQLDFIKSLERQNIKFNQSILDLNHDWQDATIEALDTYIPLIKARGYEFVTMDECV